MAILVLAELARTEIHNHVDGVVEAGVVIAFLKGWDHLFLDDAFARCIGDILLHTITGTDVGKPSFTVLFGFYCNDYTIVLSFLSHTPTMANFRGILMDVVALKVIHEQNENLSGGAVVVSDKFSLQSVDLRTAQSARIVVRQTWRVGRTRQLGLQRRAESEQNEKQAKKEA